MIRTNPFEFHRWNRLAVGRNVFSGVLATRCQIQGFLLAQSDRFSHRFVRIIALEIQCDPEPLPRDYQVGDRDANRSSEQLRWYGRNELRGLACTVPRLRLGHKLKVLHIEVLGLLGIRLDRLQVDLLDPRFISSEHE